jgi:putative ABC transport system permease protein
METLWRNLKHGIRLFAKNRGTTVVMILSLAFGIGTCTAIFSIVHGILLNPLPYSKPDELVRIFESNPAKGFDEFSASPLNFIDWKRLNQVFENMAAYEWSSVSLTGSGDPERLSAASVTTDLFSVLDVSPILGRTFSAAEGTPGKDNVALLTYGLWKRRFGGDPRIVGKSVRLDGTEHIVIGVMPRFFSFPSEETEIILPLAFDTLALSNRGAKWLGVIARLKPGINLLGAQQNMDLIAKNLADAYPDKNKQWGVRLRLLKDTLVGDVRKPVMVLFGAVLLVLLIGCANVAGLLLAENAARQQEMAIRTALGAKRKHLLLQLLTESVLISLIGGICGLLLALWTKDSILLWAEKFLPRVAEISINLQVLSFALGLSIVTGILFGILPAILITRPDAAMRSQSRAFTQGGTRTAFVVGEVALAMVLLCGAGLLIRSLYSMLDVSPGFDPHNLFHFTIQNPESRYPERSQVGVFHLSLLEQLKQIPGVHDAAAANLLPLTGEDWSHSLNFKGHEVPEADEPSAEYRVVSADYFRTMRIPLRSGRFFTDRDSNAAPLVSIINEAFAKRFVPGQNPIGQEVRIGDTIKDYRRIVGVSGNVKEFGLGSESVPVIYVPLAQRPLRYMNYVVRTDVDPVTFSTPVRQIIRSLDREMPIFQVGTMENVLSDSISRRKFTAYLLMFFAVTALALALTGLYGLLSYSVSQRTREIGVRIAMGAEPLHVLRLIFGSGIRLLIGGVVVGFLATLAATRILKGMLFQITATDPVTLAGVVISIIVVALLAMYLPAKRAAHVDPLEALRYE